MRGERRKEEDGNSDKREASNGGNKEMSLKTEKMKGVEVG